MLLTHLLVPLQNHDAYLEKRGQENFNAEMTNQARYYGDRGEEAEETEETEGDVEERKDNWPARNLITFNGFFLTHHSLFLKLHVLHEIRSSERSQSHTISTNMLRLRLKVGSFLGSRAWHWHRKCLKCIHLSKGIQAV